MIELIINSFWIILPAYCSNFFPVVVRGKTPIDLNKNFIDNKRVFGDGKTIRGFISGSLFGIFIGMLQIYLQQYTGNNLIFNHTVLSVILLSVGALIGDLIGSFVKRRFEMKRGDPAPLLDQLDFVIMSLVLLSLAYKINFSYIFFLVLITPILHLFSNLTAYILKLKNKPW
ncbi:MAG: hypothetical protein B6U88_01040 [Candidatus Aenigmarchaeota archaeon ex4484_56]|nr:MAG: hypothetical protein B6U88_01040 [Candidatus Aenigmarchaeota archaeon ex4484_56]